MLVHAKTRQTVVGSLKGAVVVFDEAHNLIDAINDVYSARIDTAILAQAQGELSSYREKYRTRLSENNRTFIDQLLVVMKGLFDFLKARESQKAPPQTITLNEMLFRCHIDHVNLLQLETYVEKSKICQKLRGFVASTGALGGTASPSFQHILPFLEATNNTSADGHVLVHYDEEKQKGCMKYVMLNAEVHFRSIVGDARAVLLAGGTMQPVDYVVSQLFPNETSRLLRFSCGHVIPPESMHCVCISKGPSGRQLNLSFRNRSTKETKDEIGRALANLCSIVPEGMVVFLPSYAYTEELCAHLSTSGIMDRISAKKRIFRDGLNSSRTLEQYAACLAHGDGAIPILRRGRQAERRH